MSGSKTNKTKAASGVSRGANAPRSRANDPYAPLRVLSRLIVGPVKVERNRLSATYTVESSQGRDSIELAYRYEEPVFEPGEAASENLAAMAAAQVAINYGLFCDEIVFHGPYDAVDQQFIADMAENTAREILVKKFLEPNPFLHGPAAELKPVATDHYLFARLRFDGTPASNQATGSTDRGRHLILSSGGKDSLLSFGLLDEMRREAHPVFVNESGKHWFTALNAYRVFQKHCPTTGRVWTNADRVFSWMLRHVPFIRQDFLSVRSDEYPIRLWTVAVFLFGVLPVAHNRGVGRIIIGDEYDTTERRTFKGIQHFNGLFDQSRYFDETLTRYYAAKQWDMCQFSMLRWCSEMLIEKVLAKRYPELLRLQVSCHAAHTEGDRVHPCGQCEKCRRIVGMLLAMQVNPKECGYSATQVERCLKDLAAKGVHQETEGAQHLAHLLQEAGRLPEGRLGGDVAKANPQVMSLRFERERAPVASIPNDLREPLFRILLEHAEGAVRRSGKVWVNFDPFAPREASRSYAFEPPVRSKREKESMPSKDGAARNYVWGQLTWPEAQARFKKVDVALLPVGAIEQHGPHLPLDTDAFDAEYLAETVAQRCSDPKPLVLPLIPYGVSYHHDDFSGTISISNETLSRLVYEIGLSVAKNGVTKLIVINGHGGNAATLNFAAQMINRDARIFTCVDTGETSDTDINRISETPGDVHAGEIETSTTLAVRPEVVRMDKAKKYVPRFSSRYLDFSSKRSVDWYARTLKISPSGVMGDPTKASREKGERMWAVMIQNLVEFVEHLKSMSLDEIHQRNRF